MKQAHTLWDREHDYAWLVPYIRLIVDTRHKTFKNVPILSGTTFDIGVPFTYNLPNSTASLVYTGRKMEDEHSAVFEMAEDLLNKWVITLFWIERLFSRMANYFVLLKKGENSFTYYLFP